MTLTNFFTELANAIREKLKTTAKILPENMASSIDSIVAGNAKEYLEGTATSLTIPTATSVLRYKFKNNTYISEIDGEQVTTIGTQSFYGCTNLVKAYFANCTSIGQEAFRGCTSLSDIKFDNIQSISGGTISDYTFYGCKGLKTFDSSNFPNITELGVGVFINSGLETINSKTLIKIGRDCFNNCSGVTSIELPNLQVLGNQSLGYIKISELNLPECIEMGYDIFEGARSTLERLILPKIQKFTSAPVLNQTALSYVELGNEEINETKFQIIKQSFSGCSALSTLLLKFNAVIPLVDVSAFANSPIEAGTGYIYVPDALVEEYKIATNWVTFAEQIKPLSEYKQTVQ